MRRRLEDLGYLLTRSFASTRRWKRRWPYVPGKYFVADRDAPVAVTTLGSVELAGEIAARPPPGLCIVGKVETENIGIEKLVRNVVSNPAIRVLICAGREPPRHLTGGTLLALFRNGVDERRRIVGAPGMRPVLPNATAEEIRLFRDRVTPIDMVGCTDRDEIARRVTAAARPWAGEAPAMSPPAPPVPGGAGVTRAEAVPPERIKLDPAGYFVVQVVGASLQVEHYDNRNRLLHTVVGRDARSLYLTIVGRGWVSRLDHAAYLGKELARAELSMRLGFEYVQDGA